MLNPDASGRLPNPRVGEIFGSAILEFGPEASGSTLVPKLRDYIIRAFVAKNKKPLQRCKGFVLILNS